MDKNDLCTFHVVFVMVAAAVDVIVIVVDGVGCASSVVFRFPQFPKKQASRNETNENE